MQVGDAIQKRGARIIVLAGVGLMGLGVLGLTVIDRPWQLYLAFLVMIPGWAAMGGAAINTIVAQWFHRRRVQLLSQPRYLTMVGAFSLGLLAQISFIAHQAAFLVPTLGLKEAGWVVSVTALAALVGRFSVGLVIDRVDRRGATSANLAVQVAGMIVLLQTSSVFGLYLGCILFGFGVGNLITLPGLIVQQEFSRRQPERRHYPARRRDGSVDPGRTA